MVLQIITMFPNIEFEYAQTILQRKNWNLESAIQEHKGSYMLTLNLHTAGIPGLPEMI
jgi:hypothetical protein